MAAGAEEVTVKEIFHKLRGWFIYLLSKSLWIIIAGLVGGGSALLYVWNQKPKYTAATTFILSNNSNNSGLYGLANQFGVDLGSNSDAFSGDNIISLMNSKTMAQKALLQIPPGTHETLLNLFVEDTKLGEGWSKNPRTKGSYPFPADADKMSYVQDSLFRDVYYNITANNLTVSRPDNQVSVYEVSTISNNEIFSLYLTKFLVQATSKFYIDTKTSVARSNLTMLQREADSIHNILRSSVSSTAKTYDYTFNLNPAFQSQRIPAQEGQLSITALSSAYSEVLRNLELAKISLQKETPLYQIIDEPELPLIAEKTSKLIALIAGGFAGGFILMVYFILRKTMSEVRAVKKQAAN